MKSLTEHLMEQLRRDDIMEHAGILKAGSYNIKTGYGSSLKILGTIETGNADVSIIRTNLGDPMIFTVPQEHFIEILKSYKSKSHKDICIENEHGNITYLPLPHVISVYDPKVSRWCWEFPAYSLDDIIKDNKNIF